MSNLLRIPRVRNGDDGVYRCRVDYREARTTTFESRLSVIRE